MEYKDYYKILGVSRDASADDIKRAYRKLARKYHPDVSKEKDAEQHFKEVGEAYEVLKDPKKRAAYDQLGHHWRAGDNFQPPPGWNFGFDFGSGGFTGGGQPFDFSDFFETLFGRGQGPGAPPGYTHQTPFRTPGEDHHAKVVISLEEAYHGANRVLQLRLSERDSMGQKIPRIRTLNVKIPAGVTEGQKIRLAGQGEPGLGGESNGDLYLEIEFQPHRFYRAEGKDVFLNLPIAPWEAALGASVAVSTLGGKVELKIPAGSTAGQKLRLKGRGLPGTPPGDQYVTLQLVTPPATTVAAENFYRKMAQEFPFDPRAGLADSG